MNFQELVNEIVADRPAVYIKAGYFTSTLRREAIKTKKIVRKWLEYTSPRKNTWLIESRYYHKNPTFTTTIYFNTGHGINAMLAVKGENNVLKLVHYTSHFLQRYNERFIKAECSTISTLKHFLSNNAMAAVQPVSKESTDFHIRFNDGFGFGGGEIVGDRNNYVLVYHVKTFISDDMTFESQKKEIQSAIEIYNEHCEKQWKKKFDINKAITV